MNYWWNDPAFYATAVPVVIGVAVVGAFVVRVVMPTLRRLGHLADDMIGEPDRPGRPGRPGLMERLNEVETRTGELVRNSGSSIKDAIGRLDQRSERLDERTQRIDVRLIRLEQTSERTEHAVETTQPRRIHRPRPGPYGQLPEQ